MQLPRSMRHVFLAVAALAALALAGCPEAKVGDSHGDVADGGVILGNNPVPQCVTDDQCVLAGASCCSCPSYAVAADDPGVDACGGVECPMPVCPTNLRASCVQGSCAMTCQPLQCDLTCDNGFAIDANGCLTCTCAVTYGSDDTSGSDVPHACGSDADCREVEADCCGCARGGSDTAADARDVAALQASLACPSDPLCPGNDTCDADAALRCVAGRCFLLPTADQTVPAFACGRPDLHPAGYDSNGTPIPGCPTFAGQAPEVCTINALATANAQGIGVCLSGTGP